MNSRCSRGSNYYGNTLGGAAVAFSSTPRASEKVSLSASPPESFRIVAPTAILGYGFPEASFNTAMSSGRVDLVAVDAGSIDPGPYYLATRTSFTAIEHVVRDLRIMIRGFLSAREHFKPRSDNTVLRPYPKLVVGSAGGCGTSNQVELMAREVRRLLVEEAGAAASSDIAIATVTSEIERGSSSGKMCSRDFQANGHSISPLGPQPGGVDRGCEHIDDPSTVLVAQMGLDPIMCALDNADLVICGRAYDPAVFAAEPVRRGFPAAPALHAAKVLECGAIATVPGSGSDCLVADLFPDGASLFWAPNTERTATPLSVAAHTLYEKGHPHLFGMPGGYLNTTNTTFFPTTINIDSISSMPTQVPAVRCTGTVMTRTAPSVKLEGARVRGQRAVRLVLENDESENVAKRPCDPLNTTSTSANERTSVSSFVYGKDGVEQRTIDSAIGEQELGILVSVRRKVNPSAAVFSHGEGKLATHDEISKGYLALLRATLLHYGFEGRKATAGNLAFPFSPSDLVCARKDGFEYITVCGTRDPGFIKNHVDILRKVEDYVASLSEHKDDVEVRFIVCGLQGKPKLRVEESVADTFEAAVSALESDILPEEQRTSHWICSGGMAADFNVHHLVTLDNEMLQSIFHVNIHKQKEDGTIMSREKVTPILRNWGEEAGDVSPLEVATATWQHSLKPEGITLVGTELCELADVVRSKNAGVNELTFDIIFTDSNVYENAKLSPALDQQCIETLLERPVLGVYCDDTSLAIKITCDREINAGSAGDRDVYGAQQHAKLVRYKI